MAKHQKINITEARYPLGQLSLSPLNPRQNVPEAEIAELAQSIWEAGLIQSIAGYATSETSVEIVAGGRRLRALQLLAQQHPDLATVRPELANPLVMLAPSVEMASVWASLENVARRDLHPAEEIRAYGKMEKAGSLPAAIARAFAVTEKHVYRRLALAKLPAPVLDALAANEISLSMAQCFTICDDQERALQVLDQCRGEGWSDHNLKRLLKPDTIRASDRRAIFVGLESYTAAGGSLTTDLFANDTLIDDPALLERLFVEKLHLASLDQCTAEGWAWAETINTSYIGWNTINDMKCDRIYPETGALSEDEAEQYDELAELSEAGALDDEGETELARLQAILDGGFSAEQKAVSGVLVHVNDAGVLVVTPGLIKQEQKAAAVEAGILAPSHHKTATPAEPKSPISAALVDDLARIKTGARQHAALRDPDLLIALLTFQLTGQMGYRPALGLRTDDVPNFPTSGEAGYALDPRLTTPTETSEDKWTARSPEAFEAFRAKGAEHIAAELTRHIAALITGGDKAFAAYLDQFVGTSIRSVWTPTAENFFARVGGPYLVDLWRDLLGLRADHPTVTTFEKLKKSEKAAKLESLFSDPATRAALGLTAEQEEAIATWLPDSLR